MKSFVSFSAVLVAAVSFGQTADSDLIGSLEARALGPTTMGGRVSDLAVYEKEPRIFYVGVASGGVWKTVNGGITMEPVFFSGGTSALGAVAVSQKNPDLVYIGTGEQNNRNSSSWGDGLYKTTDGGKTWSHIGLKDSRHVGGIVIDPRSDNRVLVGALGNLWGPSPTRGVYLTEDGGKTWTRTLKTDNDLTGVIDIQQDPKNPNNLLAATYERRRWAFRWQSGGPGSAIYRSTDGGRTWKKSMSGLPTSGDFGRIGLNYFRKDPKVVVASVEHATDRGIYRSMDGGQTWTKVNPLNPRPFYFSKIRQDPNDFDRIYMPGVSFHYTTDAGKTFRSLPMNIHVDHHALWINPNDSNHMINGNDGGVAQTRDRGLKWEHINSLDIGQFYAIAVDMRKPYFVYGGLQDNGSWGGPSQHPINGGVKYTDWYQVGGGDGFHVQVDPEDWRIVYSESQGGALGRLNQVTGERAFIRPRPPQGETYRFNWSSPLLISPHNPRTIYFGGNRLFKSVNRGDNWRVISEDLTTNDPAKIISRNNPSGGVTPEDTGAERHCTIVTISESPRVQGLLWVGTDDGLVWLSRNDGQTWEKVTVPGVPANTWVSRVTASSFAEGRAYVTFDSHRNDDYKPYVFMTDDFGATWTPISAGLKENDSAYVIKEGLRNPDLLFLGTEIGLYASLDRGKTWTKYASGTFSTVRVDDLVIHPREFDLVVGTHGRSIWIVPINALEDLTEANRKKDVHLVRPTAAYGFGYTQGGWFGGDRDFVSRNTQPAGRIDYWLGKAPEGEMSLQVLAADGSLVARLSATGRVGLNSVTWRPRRGLAT
ncbi:MAG: hypothetical protein MH204_12265, partial [Fimbriimonadaceae bacterium]|nr:hypothetical protein [Fimbriimonadaceae bacterium]